MRMGRKVEAECTGFHWLEDLATGAYSLARN